MPKATSAFAHSYLQHSLARHEVFYTTDINNTADHGNDYPIHSLPKDQLLAEKNWNNNQPTCVKRLTIYSLHKQRLDYCTLPTPSSKDKQGHL